MIYSAIHFNAQPSKPQRSNSIVKPLQRAGQTVKTERDYGWVTKRIHWWLQTLFFCLISIQGGSSKTQCCNGSQKTQLHLQIACVSILCYAAWNYCPTVQEIFSRWPEGLLVPSTDWVILLLKLVTPQTLKYNGCFRDFILLTSE